MALPGFSAQHALSRMLGAYGARPRDRIEPGIVPQLPIGPIGSGNGNCCCVVWNWGGILVSSSGGGDIVPAWSLAAFTPAGPPVYIGPLRIQCTECPSGDDECTCDCTAEGKPCATMGNTQVCEP
jgi:hypothetical protein